MFRRREVHAMLVWLFLEGSVEVGFVYSVDVVLFIYCAVRLLIMRKPDDYAIPDQTDKGIIYNIQTYRTNPRLWAVRYDSGHHFAQKRVRLHA